MDSVRYSVIVIAVALNVEGLLASGLEVKPDKENVVASRLAGSWKVDRELTRRLTGSRPADPESPTGSLKFSVDASVIEQIPEKYDDGLGQMRIYLAGWATIRGNKTPFLLTETSGNPHVIYFRERDDEPLGDAESFNVMLAAAEDEAKDLLFVGGDFNNQPFRAYGREPSGDVARRDEKGRHYEEEGGYSFQVPEGWKMTEIPGFKYKAFIGEPSGGFAPNIHFVDEVAPVTLPKYVDLSIDGMKRVMKELRIVSRKSFQTAVGLAGVTVVATNKQLGHNLQQTFYLLDGPEDLKYVITCSRVAGEDEETDRLLEEAARSFRLENR